MFRLCHKYLIRSFIKYAWLNVSLELKLTEKIQLKERCGRCFGRETVRSDVAIQRSFRIFQKHLMKRRETREISNSTGKPFLETAIFVKSSRKFGLQLRQSFMQNRLVFGVGISHEMNRFQCTDDSLLKTEFSWRPCLARFLYQILLLMKTKPSLTSSKKQGLQETIVCSLSCLISKTVMTQFSTDFQELLIQEGSCLLSKISDITNVLIVNRHSNDVLFKHSQVH
jgi:hypothetical protein